MKRIAIAAVGALFALAGCGAETPAASPTGSQPASPASSATSPAASEAAPLSTSIVFAAASLSKVFPEITGDADIAYSFDGSSGLVDQLKGGAPADVFASADKKNMDKAVAEGLIDGEPTMFATNYLVLVVPAGNPAQVTGFDASLDGVKLVTCAAEVPCGAATARLSEAKALTLKPVSEESSVTDVLGKVTSGEADAGIVYATDATSAGDKVETIEIDGAKDDPNTYWIALVRNAPDKAAGQAFIDAILGADGQQKLSEYGFGAPQ